MTIGHYAASLIAKRLQPALPLWGLFLAAQLVDVVWGVLILAGVETVRIIPDAKGFLALELSDMPYTHALIPFTLLWMGVAALATKAGPRMRHQPWAWATVAAVVGSHWVLDFVVHREDLLLLYPGATKVGLSLWRMPVVAFLAEAAFFAGTLAWYGAYAKKHGRPPKRLIIFAVVWIVVLAGFAFGPPLPSATLLGVASLGLYALTIYWASKLELDPRPGVPI
jgi:hypothetical protein